MDSAALRLSRQPAPGQTQPYRNSSAVTEAFPDAPPNKPTLRHQSRTFAASCRRPQPGCASNTLQNLCRDPCRPLLSDQSPGRDPLTARTQPAGDVSPLCPANPRVSILIPPLVRSAHIPLPHHINNRPAASDEPALASRSLHLHRMCARPRPSLSPDCQSTWQQSSLSLSRRSATSALLARARAPPHGKTPN